MIVCFLVILMAIPAMFMSYVSFERSQRANEVVREVSTRYGGEQYVTGPILVAPYSTSDVNGQVFEVGQYVFFADEGRADFENVKSVMRQRSLFKVPTYLAEAKVSAMFQSVKSLDLGNRVSVDWKQAEIWVGVTDLKGLRSDVVLTLPDGSTRKFEPAQYRSIEVQRPKIDLVSAEVIKDVDYRQAFANSISEKRSLLDMGSAKYMAVPVGDILDSQSDLLFKANWSLGGTQKLGIIPYAKTTHLKISSDWPDPGFEGGFAPTSREITETGFTAEWSVPYLARGLAGEGSAERLQGLHSRDQAMTVKLVSKHNPYRTVNRALKYSVLFVGLVFITYFLFEVVIGIRVHPAQYLLIGLAQSVFYLLLLAFSERTGFTIAFLIAAIATISVTAAYAGAVFGDRKYSLRAGAVFIAVYSLLYVLMRLQDFALIVGALTAFLVVTLTMYLTRNVHWYGDTNHVS